MNRLTRSDNLKPWPFCGQTEYLVVGTDVNFMKENIPNNEVLK